MKKMIFLFFTMGLLVFVCSPAYSGEHDQRLTVKEELKLQSIKSQLLADQTEKQALLLTKQAEKQEALFKENAVSINNNIAAFMIGKKHLRVSQILLFVMTLAFFFTLFIAFKKLKAKVEKKGTIPIEINFSYKNHDVRFFTEVKDGRFVYPWFNFKNKKVEVLSFKFHEPFEKRLVIKSLKRSLFKLLESGNQFAWFVDQVNSKNFGQMTITPT